MNAAQVRAALAEATGGPVGWWTSGDDGYLHIGDEANIDALIVVGPFRSDQAIVVGGVSVGLNGADEQSNQADIEGVVAAVKELLSTR